MLNYELILVFAAWGYLWPEVLTQPGMIFGWVPKLFSWVPLNLQKPLFACVACVAGSWSFVASLIALSGLLPAIGQSVLSMAGAVILNRLLQ